MPYRNSLPGLLTILASFFRIECCVHLEVYCSSLGSIVFHQLALEDHYRELENQSIKLPDDSGRASYLSVGHRENLYLYHTMTENEKDGIGRWVLGHALGDKSSAVAYANSWAIAPHLIAAAADNPNTHATGWLSARNGLWQPDETFGINCHQCTDRTVFFESSAQYQSELSGFYVERHSASMDPAVNGAVYSHIKPRTGKTGNAQLYLSKLPESSTWMIGEQFGVDSGAAFTSPSPDVYGEDATHFMSPADLPHTSEWRFVARQHNNAWQTDTSALLLSPLSRFDWNGRLLLPGREGGEGEEGPQLRNIYEVMRFARSLKSLPTGQAVSRLRNGLPMPQLGLGTGGIWPEHTLDVLTRAGELGYRLLDLAREYKNEHIVREYLQQQRQQREMSADDRGRILRGDIFLESKVWPTDLGFQPTLDAVAASLRDLGTNYVDAYLLHWHRCMEGWSWMHCETTVDPAGTWRESWRALEREYAEGRLLSIGVSNFDVTLLEELKGLPPSGALVLPHVVQNHGEPGNIDAAVRSWCDDPRQGAGAVYQPYASLRNLAALPVQPQQALSSSALKRGVSEHAVALRFFLQTGAACIPRSTQTAHLRENLQVLQWKLEDDEMRALGWTGINIDSEL